MATRVILTYDDYAAIPNDGRRYEVHEGEISVTPAPSPKHQRSLLNLLVVLQQHVKSRNLGEVFVSPIDCILSNITIVQPDIVYLATDRLSAVSQRGIEGAPTLAIEVLSPSTSQIDRVVKLQLYARHGVPFYWIADPDARTIEAYTLAAGAYELTARLEAAERQALPPFLDLRLDPAALWLSAVEGGPGAVLDCDQGRSAMAIRVILTYDDYAAIPNDGRRYEVHEGELSVTPAPSPRHQRVIGNLFVILRQHVVARGTGEVFVSPIDCILSDVTIVQPDIVYLATDRLSAVSQRGIEAAPTLAIEVLSPSTSQIDRVVKLQLYARHGVPFYWIVDPDARTIETYALAAGAYQLAARLEGAEPRALPPFLDLRLDPAALWA